jgi:serine/threonine protein kinase
MSLTPGAKLGPYEILAALGAGGMGEVYKARDTRLDRTVAIKILPQTLAADPQFRERFDREARTISQLDHPHICALYDVGEQQGTAYLVMQYLEGETLESRLKKGALPLGQALQVAVQIGDALTTAHKAGIVHRDLKPGNIMLTKSGAKLLDFGLAKTNAPAVAGAGVSMLPTTPPNLTAHGTILGTFQYMAPEQLEGHEADPRADIFAFGAVVYEMLTGRKAFQGKSQASLIGAILKDEPLPISTVRPLTPPLLDRVVKKCLAKEPSRRWQTASDLHDELTWIADGRSEPVTSGRASPGRRAHRLTWVLATVATLAVAAASGIAAWKLKPDPPRAVRRFAVALPEGSQLPLSARMIFAVSPDATHLVYAATAANAANSQLYLRAMDQIAAKPIPGTAGSEAPFFSPDGQWIGFSQNGRLKKVATSGGAPQDLCEATYASGASWPSPGRILFGRGPDGIWQVSADGGQPSRLITVDAKKEIAYGPQMLPGGKAVLFTVASQELAASGSNQSLWDNAQIVVQSLDSGTRTVVVRNGADARYVASGHLVYVRQGTLLAVPFDLARNAAIGNPVPAVDGIQEATIGGVASIGRNATGAAQFTVSQNGLFAYIPQDLAALARTLVWVDRHGHETPISVPERAYAYPRISPDGTHAVVDSRDQEQHIWTWDFSRENLNRVTFDPAADIAPLWTPDGRRIVFLRPGQGLFSKAADGTGAEDHLTESGTDVLVPNTFSHDGTRLVFEDQTAQGWDLKMLSHDDKRVVDLIAQPIVNELNADISPDGRWLVYQSDESGQNEIYVRPFPTVQGGQWKISPAGGTRPLWARSGRELFYLASGGTVMATPIESSSSFKWGNPTKLFSGPYYAGLNGRTYDVSSDGQQFLMIKAVSTVNTMPRIIVVENWLDELKRLVPTTH